MENDPLSFPPIEARVENFGVDGDNHVWVRLAFDDDTQWDVEVAGDSPEARHVLDAFTDMATQLIQRVAGRGLVITGLTPIEEEEDEE